MDRLSDVELLLAALAAVFVERHASPEKSVAVINAMSALDHPSKYALL
jgi:hypothetical protein